MNIVTEVADHIMEAIEDCVFGQQNVNKMVPFFQDGKERLLRLSVFVQQAFMQLILRQGKVHREVFPIFEHFDIGADEKETVKNCETLRSVLHEFVKDKRRSMKDPNYKD